MKFDVIARHRIWFTISSLLVIISLVSIFTNKEEIVNQER